MEYVGNSFSLQMLDNFNSVIKVSECSYSPRKDVYSIFGHEDTAKLAGFPFNRETVKLKVGDILYVFQVVSGRLVLGTEVLPSDIKTKWLKVEVIK